MKKTIRRILNAATLVAMVLVMALSVLTITTFNSNAAGSENGASNVNDSQNTAGNISDTTDVSDENAENDINFTGIYKFTTNVGLENVYYKSGEDFKHLRTENDIENPYDVNAIYHDMKNRGFDDYAKVITHYDELFRAIYFNNGKAQMMTYDDKDVFTFIPEDHFDFEYTVSESGIEITTEEAKAHLTVQYNAESNIPSLYYLFDGYDYLGTQFYIRADLSYVYDSANLLVGDEYSFNSQTITILSTNTENTFINVYVSLAKALGFIEEADTKEYTFKEIESIVTEKFASCTLIVNETDFTRIVIKLANGSYRISSSETVNDSPIFVWNNTEVKFNSAKYDANTETVKLNFTILVDENAAYNFTYSVNK